MKDYLQWLRVLWQNVMKTKVLPIEFVAQRRSYPNVSRMNSVFRSFTPSWRSLLVEEATPPHPLIQKWHWGCSRGIADAIICRSNYSGHMVYTPRPAQRSCIGLPILLAVVLGIFVLVLGISKPDCREGRSESLHVCRRATGYDGSGPWHWFCTSRPGNRSRVVKMWDEGDGKRVAVMAR